MDVPPRGLNPSGHLDDDQHDENPRGESQRADWKQALQPALIGWLLARACIAIAYFISTLIERSYASSHDNVTRGLFMWDGGHYRAIVEHWYGGVPDDTARFFPLYPGIAKAISWLPGITGDMALLLVAHIGAFAAAVVVWLLVQEVFRDHQLAHRSAVFIAVFPAAYVLTLAYTESLAVLAVACTLLHLHRQNWWWVATWACVAASLRPTGGIIALAILVEVIRLRPWDRIVAVLSALAAAPVGLVVSMWVISLSTNDFWAPVTLQSPIRGEVQDPFSRAFHSIWWIFRDDPAHAYDAFYVVLFLVAVGFMIKYRHPISWIVYSIATLVLVMSSTVITSIGRYGMVAIPLVIVIAQWATSTTRERVLIALSSMLFIGFAVAAFMSWTVP